MKNNISLTAPTRATTPAWWGKTLKEMLNLKKVVWKRIWIASALSGTGVLLLETGQYIGKNDPIEPLAVVIGVVVFPFFALLICLKK